MTPRQGHILGAIVELYAETAEPVGSLALSQSFELSPATIRSEMVALEQAGYIRQPHTSAGRIPTDKGYRAYVNGMQASTSDGRVESAIARRVQSAGHSVDAIRAATDSLAEVTGNVGLATMPDRFYFTGLASLFGQPEFFDQTAAREAARLLDSLDEWLAEAAPQDSLSVYIGGENPIGKSSGCSLVIARFASPYSDHSYIGIMGPTRQSYRSVMGLVSTASRLLEEALI